MKGNLHLKPCRISYRVLFTIMVFFECSFILTGCHGSRSLEAFKLPEEFDTSRNYEITFWAKNDTNKTQTMIYEQAINDFEALYPNISISLRLYTDYGRIYNDVITNMSTGTTPNVCISYPDHIATYLTGTNVLVPLEELFSDESYGLGGDRILFDSPTQEELIPKFLSECALEDHYYAVPFMRSSEVCYINRTYVEALGYTLPEQLTWDFIWEVSDAAAVTDSEGNYPVNGQKIMIPFIYKSTDNMMIQMLRQNNAGYSDSLGEILIFNDTTKELLYTIAEQTKAGAFSTFKISSYPANFLNAGQCLFAIDSTAGSTWMGTNAPLSDISEESYVNFETEVMIIPQFDTDNPQMISQGPSICLFNKSDSQEVLASWLFTQYLLTNDVQIAYSQTEGYVPVTTKAQNSEEYQAYLSHPAEDNSLYYDIKIKATKLLLDNIDNTFVTPVFNGSASLRDAAGQMIENVTKSVKRKEIIDETYMSKLFDSITSLYRLDQINSRASLDAEDLGPLPLTSVLLLSTLVLIWLAILVYVITGMLRKQKRQQKHKP